MARPLRGERYLRKSNESLARWLVEDLPYLDYNETANAYEVMGGQIDRAGAALWGCNDRFFLLTTLLKRRDAMHPWLFERCREIEAEPDGFLDLWAREHYKSTIGTFAGIIQEILCDPEITVGIFAFNRATAQAFLAQIMHEFETNEGLQNTYTDVLWQRPRVHASMWAKSVGMVVKRQSNPKEATVEAHGLVDGQPTSKHFRLLVYDDVITRESVTNPEQIKKVTEAWELSDNLGSGEARKWHFGTRYHFGDTYGVILERSILKARLYPATHDGRLTGQPVFLSKDVWEKKKITQRSQVAAQMLQNPLAGQENTFKAQWLHGFDVRPETLTVYIMADPSRGMRGRSSDRTAIAVVGIDSAGNKYLLDGYRHRMNLSERWKALRDLHWKWSGARGVQHVAVGYERYGAQSDDEYFQEQMERDGKGFPIAELNWTRDGAESKKDRVQRLEPDFSQGRFFLPAVVWEPGGRTCLWAVDTEKSHIVTREMKGITRNQAVMRDTNQSHRIVKAIMRKDEDGKVYDLTRALMEEMLFFPFAPKDDLVDATSRIYDMEPFPPMIYEDKQALAEVHYIDT